MIRTGDGLSTTRISDTDELGHEHGVRVVVPVTETDGVFAIVRVRLVGWVDDQRCAQTISILPLHDGERPYRISDTGRTLEWACAQNVPYCPEELMGTT